MMARALRAALLILAAAALAACALPGLPRTPPPPDGGAQGNDQVLVMLRMAPVHFRGGSGYGGDYGAEGGAQALKRSAAALARARHLEVLSEWPMPALGVDCFLMRVPDARPLGALVEALSGEPGVAWAQELQDFHALGHDDPLFALQPAATAWHLAQVHAVTTGREVLIAQVDSGVQVDHPDLQGQVALSADFVDDGPYRSEAHGTAIAGVIAARADNGIGIVGVAPDARLLALRACWETPAAASRCNSFTLAKALQFALNHGAGIINLSLTGPDDRLLGLLLDAAQASGIAVVGAYDPDAPDGGFPARHPGVIAVAASGTMSSRHIVFAPGTDIPATLPGSRWGFVNGSSFAAAQVSGMVALMRQLRPALRPAQLQAALLAGTTMPAGATGLVAVDACSAISLGTGVCACQCRTPTVETAVFHP